MSAVSASGSAHSAASAAPPHSRSSVSARELALLTMPQLGLMLCHMGMSMTDVTITGLISPAAQASLGVVGQVFTLLMLVASLVGSGCLAAVSQALGMGLARRAARYAALIVVLALFVGGRLADGAMRAGASALIAGDGAVLFWVVLVLGGLAAPFVLEWGYPMGDGRVKGLWIAFCILMGAAALRAGVVGLAAFDISQTPELAFQLAAAMPG